MSLIENTIACVITFGSRWRAMMRASERPAARAASTYSRRFCTRISPRTMRAYDTQPTTVIAMMIERCPGPEHEHERDHEHEEREGDDDVDEAHHDGVDEAPVVAGQAAERRADAERAEHGEERDEQIDAAGVDEAREHVAAELVGAEPVRAAGVRVGVQQVLRVGVVARDQRRCERSRARARA